MTGSLASLVNMFRPRLPRNEFDWQQAESELQAPIPGDYRELVECFGLATFCGALDLLAPSGNGCADIAASSLRNRQFFTSNEFGTRPTVTGRGRPFDPGTLITWANLPGGDYWLWHPDPADPTDTHRYETVVVDVDLVEWLFLDKNASDAVHGFVTGVEPSPDRSAVYFLEGDPPYVDIDCDIRGEVELKRLHSI